LADGNISSAAVDLLIGAPCEDVPALHHHSFEAEKALLSV
jgi:hypothetical protein